MIGCGMSANLVTVVLHVRNIAIALAFCARLPAHHERRFLLRGLHCSPVGRRPALAEDPIQHNGNEIGANDDEIKPVQQNCMHPSALSRKKFPDRHAGQARNLLQLPSSCYGVEPVRRISKTVVVSPAVKGIVMCVRILSPCSTIFFPLLQSVISKEPSG